MLTFTAHTFSPARMHNASVSMAMVSRRLRSIRRPTSISSSDALQDGQGLDGQEEEDLDGVLGAWLCRGRGQGRELNGEKEESFGGPIWIGLHHLTSHYDIHPVENQGELGIHIFPYVPFSSHRVWPS